jgi:hypothetical protein
MASLAQFAKNMKALSVQVEVNTTAEWRKCALAVDQALVSGTPVDTGRARSNWRVTTGSPASGTREPYAPGAKGSTATQNTRAALAEGEQVIKTAPAGSVIYITNNLDYIAALNAGHSAQAPAGFVELAIQAGVNSVKGARII